MVLGGLGRWWVVKLDCRSILACIFIKWYMYDYREALPVRRRFQNQENISLRLFDKFKADFFTFFPLNFGLFFSKIAFYFCSNMA